MNILITGHSRGLGAALTAHYLAEGARVFGLSRHILPAAPGLAQVTCDLADTDTQAELRAVDREDFPSVARLQDAHGTAAMPVAAEVARRIAAALPALRTQASGSYADLRSLVAG